MRSDSASPLPHLGLAIQTPEVAIPVPVALLSGSLEEKLTKAKAWGADGIELMTVDPASLDAQELRASLGRSTLGVCAVASGALAFAAGLTLLSAEPDRARMGQSRLHDLIDLAAGLGAPLVTIGSFRGRLASMAGDGRASLIAILREAAEDAEGKGVRLVIEPLNRYETDLIHTADEGLRFLDELGHPAVGLLLDTYHMNIEESSWRAPLEQAMRARRLWHVHIGDNHRLAPGRGMIPFQRIVAILRELGYSRYLSAELLARPDPDSAARETLQTMRAILGQDCRSSAA